MPRPGGRCPRCKTQYPWGMTVCATCHVGLDPATGGATERPTALVFESWDRPSVDVVVALLEERGVPCLVRGTPDATHFGIGPANFWRVFVRTADEPAAQEILDAEIGREEPG